MKYIMGLFTKKENVPEIPIAPTLPELPKLEEPELKKETLKLPSFPSNSKNENLNQEMVKSAVTDIPPLEENAMSEQPKTLSMIEESKNEHLIPPKPSIQNPIPIPPKMPFPTNISKLTPKPITPKPIASIPPKQTSHQDEPVFVRIDKFQTAQKDFESIKNKIKEIELVLKKIKDVKLQEEEELKGWNEDIGKIKSRLVKIDDGIFNQV